VNQKILQSAGDLGVPRVTPRPTTTTKEFQLSGSKPTSARRKVEVPDELNRPLYSSFGKPSAARKPVALGGAHSVLAAKRSTAAKSGMAAASTPRATGVEQAKAVAPKALASTAPPVPTSKPTAQPKPASPVLEGNSAAAVDTGADVPIMEPNASPEPITATKEPIVEAASDENWELVPESTRVPTGARRVWAQDQLPSYLADDGVDEATDDAEDADYKPPTKAAAPAPAVSKARVWAKDALPSYLASVDGEEEEDVEDADYQLPQKTQPEAAAPAPAVSKARVWAKDALPSYLASVDGEAEEEEEETDEDYQPTPREVKAKARATTTYLQSPAGKKRLEEGKEALAAMSQILSQAASVVAEAEQLTAPLVPPTIVDESMAAYTEHSGTTPSKAVDIA